MSPCVDVALWRELTWLRSAEVANLNLPSQLKQQLLAWLKSPISEVDQ
jgi:hypothetical protein